MKLRPQRPDDEPFLRELHHAGRADETAAAGWPAALAARFLDEQFRRQSLHFATRHPAAEFLILTSGGRSDDEAAIGRLYLDKSATTWRLLEIGLLPAWQGRGIGATLIRQVQHDVSAAGATALSLSVMHTNPRAAALYARLGFVEAVSLVPTHRTMVWRSPDAATAR